MKAFQKLAAKAKEMFGGKVFQGVDYHGNKFYTYTEAGIERRTVDYVDGIPDPDKPIPVEWFSWLHNVRKDAPTPELMEKLANEREIRRQNAIKWEEEVRRKELEAQLDSSANFNQHTTPHHQAYDPNAAHISADEKQPFATLVQQYSSQENIPGVRQTKPNFNSPYSSAAAASSATPQPISNSKSAKQQASFIDPSAYKAPNTSDLNSEQHRDVLKAYQAARTSPFQGLTPQVRSNSFAKKEEAEQLTQQNNKNEKINAEIGAKGEAQQQAEQKDAKTVNPLDIDAYNKYMEEKKKKLLNKKE